ALVEVGADRHKTVMCKPPRAFDVELAPTGQMMDQHHARERPGAFRLCGVSGDRRALVALDRDVLAGHASVKCPPYCSWALCSLSGAAGAVFTAGCELQHASFDTPCHSGLSPCWLPRNDD